VPVWWFLVQPDLNDPTYDWTLYDETLGAVPEGIHILANISADHWLQRHGYAQPGSYMPVDVEQYRAFVRATVERYDGDGIDDMPGLENPVKYWQVDNEPKAHLSGFAYLQRITYEAIKDVCPDCTVLIGGAAGFPENYLRQFDEVYGPILAELGGEYIDVFDFHWYGTADGQYRLRDTVTGEDVYEHIRSVLISSGFPADLPIWITEMGSYSGDPAEPRFPLQSERQQAQDHFKRYIYALSRGVEKVFLAFGLMEGFGPTEDGYFDHTGLIYDGRDSDDLGLGVKKLGYYTYKKMTEVLEGADWSTLTTLHDGTESDHLYLFRLLKDERPIYITWWDYFDEASYTAGDTKPLTLMGLTDAAVRVTAVVPSAERGRDVLDYSAAFPVQTYPVVDGAVTIPLGEDPVLIEMEEPVTARREPLYVVIMTHVEGDRAAPEGSPCTEDLYYQTAPLPPPGQPPRGNSFAIDVAGTELLHEILQRYTDYFGEKPKLFIEPAGEFWQTEADPAYGGKLFRKYDWLELGYEFGIQGHGIYYSGQGFCWYESPRTEEGIRRKLTDLHRFAEGVYHNGQKVNAGLTLTPGAKIEGPAIGRARAEWVYDHVAYELGYRISFEDHDGHLEDEPPGINNSRSSYYLYEADYGDGVKMLKIDFNGSVRDDCRGNTPRCETPEEAIARLDRTLAAQAQDLDPGHVYYFAFTVHSNGIWTDFHMKEAGRPLRGEGAGLTRLMDAIQERVDGGANIKFVTPGELAAIFEAANPSPISTPSLPTEQLPIHLVYVNHVEVESVLDYAPPLRDGATYTTAPQKYASTSGQLEWEIAQAEAVGARISFHMSGAYAERTLAAADQALWAQHLADGHTVGVHFHKFLRGPEPFQWTYSISPAQDEIEKAWRDNHALVGELVGAEGLWVGESHYGCPSCWEELGYRLKATEQMALLPAGQHIVWLVERDPSGVITYPHFPQIGEAGWHGPAESRTFFDLRLPQLKKEFLMLYLEWLERERRGLEPQVWAWGWVNHAGRSTARHATEIEEMLTWLSENFVGRTSPRGNTIAKFVSDHELLEIYEAYERSGGRPLPSPLTHVNDQFPYMAYALKNAGVVADLSSDLGLAGVRLFELERDPPQGQPSQKQRVYLLFRETDGAETIDISAVLRTRGVEATSLTLIDVVDGSRTQVDPANLVLDPNPLVLEVD